jgi:diguanylate cyclase (GGDEF)-like protein
MTSPFADLDARLRALPDLAILTLGLLMVAGITTLRMTAAHGVPLVDFFLIPVAGVGWLTRRRGYGYAAALVAAEVSVAMAVVGLDAAPVGSALAAGAARLILYLIVLGLLDAMRHMQLDRETEARTDPLTGAANARAFRGLATAEIERNRRHRHELSLAYLDLDDFKTVNDRLGHAEGDRVLQQACHAMSAAVRSVDTLARLGGDEFVVLMPETGPADARALVERLKGDLDGLSTDDGQRVSSSIGLVTFVRPPASLQELVDAADDLMYCAKQSGKDRIEQAKRSGSHATARTASATSVRSRGDALSGARRRGRGTRRSRC